MKDLGGGFKFQTLLNLYAVLVVSNVDIPKNLVVTFIVFLVLLQLLSG